MKKLSNKKKVIIAVTTLAVFLLAGIVSIVLVLSATRQQISSNISVSYIVSGVGAKVEANYAIVPNNAGETITINQMSDRSNIDQKDQTFGVGENETTKDLTPNGDINLDTGHKQVVFEYKFQNLAESAFYIELSERPQSQNMVEKFFVTKTRLTSSQYLSKITETTLPKQAVVDEDPIYIYVMAQVDNENRGATYNGNFVWILNYAETININVNDGATVRSMKIIPTSNAPGVAMPVMIPLTSSDSSKAFGGLFTAQTDGTQYIKANGMSAHEADLAENTTLYPQFVDAYEVVNNTFNLTEAGKSGFAGSLTIPSTATAVAENACVGTDITELIIPNEVETIGDGAFQNCTSLTTVTIGSESSSSAVGDVKLSHIGTNAFKGCNNISSVTYNGTNISDWNAIAEDSLFNNHTTAIAKILMTVNYPTATLTDAGALSNCTSLIGNVVLPYGVKTIGADAFKNNTNLTGINISNSVTSIGGGAFTSCSNLTSVTIGNSVTGIGGRAFSGCGGLTIVEIPRSVTSIDNGTFLGCNSLISIIVDSNNENYSSDSYGILYNKTKTLLIQCPQQMSGSLTIPSSVTSIKYSAFAYCSNLTSIEIPNSVTSIESYAFDGCSSLTSIEIPNSVTSIGTSAFCSCTGLTRVIIGNSVTSIESYAFDGCRKLISIEIPNSVTSIGSSAFRYCGSLTSIEIPSTVTSIGGGAFAYCSKLTSIKIPSGVTSIGSGAFTSCSKLFEIYNFSNITITTTSYGLNAKVVRTDAGASYIAESDGIQYFEYNSEVVCLGPIDKEITTAIIKTSCTEINDYAFSSCSSLTSIEIPINVIFIGDYAFSDCGGLTSIVIPNSVTSIGKDAFYNCYRVTSMVFLNSDGWHKTYSKIDWQNKQNGTETDLSVASTNATYFKSTYSSYYWYKV